MNPELRVFAENKVCDVIDNIKTMDDCGRASKVIDAFESMSKDKKVIQAFRNYLCDKTFETYDKVYGKHINTTIDTSIGQIELV
jgi:hypothetical protein